MFNSYSKLQQMKDIRVVGDTRWVSLPDWDAYDDELLRVMSGDSVLASGTVTSYEETYGYWYKSREPIAVLVELDSYFLALNSDFFLTKNYPKCIPNSDQGDQQF